MVSDKYNIKQRNFDIMRNSKSNGEALYEKIMSELEPIVKTVLGEAMGVKKPMMKLNEMSDEMLNRAIVAAVDKGDFERAKKFSDYKKSEQRQENMKNKKSSESIRYIINGDKGYKNYIEGSLGGVHTKTYYGKIRIYGENAEDINRFADTLIVYFMMNDVDVVATFTKNTYEEVPNSVRPGTRCDKAMNSLRINQITPTALYKKLKIAGENLKGSKLLDKFMEVKFI